MTTEEKWAQLKAHAKKQQDQAGKLSGPAGGFIKHVWKDVLNKMWSIEKGNSSTNRNFYKEQGTDKNYGTKPNKTNGDDTNDTKK